MATPAPSPTPIPYVRNRPLNLTITQTFNDRLVLGQQLPVTITKTFRVTQSPTMVVALSTESGEPMNAILKMYDRRFGPRFRLLRGNFIPHTSEAEDAWQEYVNQDKGVLFFNQIDQEQAVSQFPIFPEQYYANSWDGRAKYEGALQHRALEYFNTETKTYRRLYNLQGRHIPMMLAHVCVSQTQGEETERYFRIPGILIQLVDGCSLWQLAERGTDTPKQEELEDVVQRAVDIVNAINDRGVLLTDCRLENVLVEKATSKPLVHDFAQYFFEEDCAYDPDDPDDQGYQDALRCQDNQGAIGLVMEKLAKEKLGFRLNIKYRIREGDTHEERDQ